MRFTEEKINEINAEYDRLRKGKYPSKNQLSVTNSFEASVLSGIMVVCSVENLKSMISDLTDLKQAIENITGIC